MNRAEFMSRLDALLVGIPWREREEALQYYNDYFDDAGAENEQDVIRALVSPEKVAENIRREAGIEQGYSEASRPEYEVTEYREVPVTTEGTPGKSGGFPTWAIVLIVILCVLASPALFGVIMGLFGVLIGFVASWLALIFALGVGAFVCFVLLIALIVIGAICIPVSPLVGLTCIGAGLIFGGLGLLFLMFTVALAGILTPLIFKGIGKLFGFIFRKKKA